MTDTRASDDFAERSRVRDVGENATTVRELLRALETHPDARRVVVTGYEEDSDDVTVASLRVVKMRLNRGGIRA